MANNEDTAQIEEQQVVEGGQESVHVPYTRFYNDDNDESEAKTSQQTNTPVNMDVSDADLDQTCPICMEQWTSSGEHRLCCLRCGHLFGYSCILRWIQHSCSSSNRRCPQCNKAAVPRHIRMLYAKKLTAVDTLEHDKLKKELVQMTTEKNHIQMELSQKNIRMKLYEQQISFMKERIAELESQQEVIHTREHNSNPSTRKLYLEQSAEICKEGGCRVFDYNPWYKCLAVSQKSTHTLFNGYGIRKVDCEYFHLRQFIFLHTQAIRDVTFHSTQETLFLSVGFDKCAKLMDIKNNMTVHTYQTGYPLWSCCWSGDNPYIFLIGAQNGSITQFDIRQTSSAIGTLDGHSDKSPVVSMATVPPNPGSGISRGGFIACHLNTCYTYEIKDSVYLPKQVFLEGPFISVRYDKKSHHFLISSRPNARQPHTRHVVCTIEKNLSTEDFLPCNIVHTFKAGNSQQLLSRPCYLYTENDTLVAAHIESSNTLALWSIESGEQLDSFSLSEPVMDLCSFDVNNCSCLTTLSPKKLRLFNYGKLA